MANPATNTLANPPLIESLIGVQFQPLAKLDLAALLDYRHLILADFPAAELAPYLENTSEVFGLERPVGMPRVRFGTVQRHRLQMIHKQNEELIQLQDSRLIVNWRRTPQNEYSGFSKVRSLFMKHWNLLQDFAEQRGEPKPEPNQWEVTSVNHIKVGSVVKDRSDWNAVLPKLFPVCEGPCPIETFTGVWQFELSEKPARLYVEVGHGMLGATISDQEVITFRLTIRGPVDRSLAEDIDFGHHVLVEQFMRLTSDRAKQLWSKR